MMKTVAFSTLIGSAGANHWAVLMAGSSGYGNYRHQADVCHAYQIFKKNNIPESNIIVLASDDIASNHENPYPGKIFNKPTKDGVPGVDVYAGCKIDYSGADVTADAFLKVLAGDATAGGKVLKSTVNDKVFVYFADHGGVGLLGVPSGGGYIHANDVNEAMKTLYEKDGYKQLLFYVQSAESGSMFKDMPMAPKVVAVTSAGPHESSSAYYCPGMDGGDMVNGKSIGSCLGDEFSIRWLEDMDAANMESETVGEQFQRVKKMTKTSHAQRYGAWFGREPIYDLLGSDDTMESLETNIDGVGVDSRQVQVHQAYFKVLRAQTAAARKEAEKKLAAILAKRQVADLQFQTIATLAMQGNDAKAHEMLHDSPGSIQDTVCHKKALESVVLYCGPFDDYTLQYSRLFANLCNSGSLDEQSLNAAIEKGCDQTIVV